MDIELVCSDGSQEETQGREEERRTVQVGRIVEALGKYSETGLERQFQAQTKRQFSA